MQAVCEDADFLLLKVGN